MPHMIQICFWLIISKESKGKYKSFRANKSKGIFRTDQHIYNNSLKSHHSCFIHVDYFWNWSEFGSLLAKISCYFKISVFLVKPPRVFLNLGGASLNQQCWSKTIFLNPHHCQLPLANPQIRCFWEAFNFIVKQWQSNGVNYLQTWFA